MPVIFSESHRNPFICIEAIQNRSFGKSWELAQFKLIKGPSLGWRFGLRAAKGLSRLTPTNHDFFEGKAAGGGHKGSRSLQGDSEFDSEF